MNDCIFCKIIKKEVPSEIVWEKENFIVIKDINPKADLHLLIIPKKHISSILTLEEEDKGLLSEMIFASRELAKRFDISKNGYKLAVNVGRGGGQIVEHLHIHFLAGKLTGLP